jgi:hypothetical protein
VQLALQQGTPPFFYMRDDVWGDANKPHSTMQLALQSATGHYTIFLYGRFFGTEGQRLNIV